MTLNGNKTDNANLASVDAFRDALCEAWCSSRDEKEAKAPTQAGTQASPCVCPTAHAH